MQFTIPRRWYSTLPQITVEIDAKYEQSSNAVRLGAAVKVFVGRASKADTRAVLTDAVLAGADLTGADLTRAVLMRAIITGADLTGAVLMRAILTGADLTGAVLAGAVLTDAVLTGAVLAGADIPVVPDIDATIYAAITDGKGELQMGAWHTCETTHCRAGWAITLAGEAGRKLEKRYGPAAAGALIYAKSRPGVPIPNFYAGDEAALADIKACAGVAS